MMWWNGVGYGMGWGGWVLMAVVMVAFWGLVVAGVLALFHSMRMDRTAPFDPDGRANGKFSTNDSLEVRSTPKNTASAGDELRARQ